MAHPGRPVRLQRQAKRAGRHGGDQRVEQAFRRHSRGLRRMLLAVAELFLEPAHHPVAAVDLHLAGEAAGQRRRIRRTNANGSR
jgi:hypothetical protein